MRWRHRKLKFRRCWSRALVLHHVYGYICKTHSFIIQLRKNYNLLKLGSVRKPGNLSIPENLGYDVSLCTCTVVINIDHPVITLNQMDVKCYTVHDMANIAAQLYKLPRPSFFIVKQTITSWPQMKCEKWTDQHETSTGQRKIWVPDSNWTSMTSQTPGNVLSTELRCMRTHGEQSFNLVHMRRASYTLLGSTLLKSLLNIKAKNFKLGNEMWKVNWSTWHNQVRTFNFASLHLGNCVHEKKSATALKHGCWNDSL